MITISTKSQEKTRVQKTEPEAGMELETDMKAGAPSVPPEQKGPTAWTRADDGTYSGPDGKHWGDRMPKVAVGSKIEAEQLVKEADATAKISGSKVSSDRDTVDTYIVEVNGRWIISGPLAALVATNRGLNLLTSGDGNPSIAVQPQKGAEHEKSGG